MKMKKFKIFCVVIGCYLCGLLVLELLFPPVMVKATMFVQEGTNKYRVAQFSGFDWCKKVAAADAWIGANPGIMEVSQAAGVVGNCTDAGFTISDNHTLQFTQGGSYSTGANSVSMGNNARLVCDGTGTNISYSGTGAAVLIPTVTKANIEGRCTFAISASAAGGVLVTNTGNSFESKARINADCSASVRTAGQYCVKLQSDNSNSAVYHNTVNVQANNIDIPVLLQSAVNNQGPNANTIYANCNGQNVCVKILDGTDNLVSFLALGGVSSPVAIQIGGAGAGGSAISNNVVGPFMSEQGAGSTTVILNSGATNNTFWGNTNDVTQFSDSSGNRSNSILFATQWTAVPGILEAGSCTGSAVHDVLCGNSSTHTLQASYNNGTFMSIGQLVTTTLTTTAAATDNVTVTGMTATGHCYLTPTNSGAAGGIASVFISAKTTNQITVTHTATAGWTFDVNCTPQ